MKFTKKYYTTNNYKDYLLRKDRYKKLAQEMHHFLSTIGLNFKDKSVLDYGCAVGFLMEGLRDLGYSKISGVEISEWAKKIVKSKKFKILNPDIIGKQELTFFLDVLEHIKESDVDKILKKLNTDFLIIRIPVCKNDTEDFFLEISRKDPTHINKKTKNEWTNVFKRNGFEFVCPINLSLIYNSEGVFCALFKNKNVKASNIYD